MRHFQWEAPDPGTWHLDDSHVKGAMTRFYGELFPVSHEDGLNESLRRYGVPITYEAAAAGGRIYYALQPVDEDELGRRAQAAKDAIERKLWRSDAASWRREIGSRLRQKNLEIQRADPSRLDDEALRLHIGEIVAHFQEGNRQHHAQCLGSWFPVGDWALRTCEWTGASPEEVFPVLQGRCPASAETLTLLDPLASAVAGDPQAAAELRDGSGDPADRLRSLGSSSSEVSELLDLYIEEYGHRSLTGFDLTDRTLAEVSEVLLASIAGRLEASAGAVTEPAQETSASARLREKVPEQARREYDALLDEAASVYGLHDEDMGIAHTWPLGLLRRALLEAGGRLTRRGALHEPEHVFDATPAELGALLGGDGQVPSPEELAQRTDARHELSLRPPPAQLGPDEEPPPLELLPPACVRVLVGGLFYVAYMEPIQPIQAEEDGLTLRGVPASPGRYSGRARIVNAPSDFERLSPGDVLVAWITSPSYNAVLPLLGAVVTDKGGTLCHTAIVAREFGIPAVVGTQNATASIPDGSQVTVDGERGIVEIGA